MIRGPVAALALVALFATGACSEDGDGTAGATTTSSPDRPASTTTTSAAPAVAASDEQILAGVTAGSAAGATLLPDERWIGGVRAGCDDLPSVPDDEIDDFFELFRIQIEDEGGSREQSRTAVEALVGGFVAACPDLGARLRALIPAE